MPGIALASGSKKMVAGNALLTSLIAAWELNESSGDAIDSHGAYDLTDTNTVGELSGWRDFESSNSERFITGDTADLRSGDFDFTIAAEVEAESLTGFPGIASKWGAADGDLCWTLYYNGSSSRLAFSASPTGFQADAVEVLANNLGAPSTSTIYHIIAYHDSVNNLIGIVVNDGTPDTVSYSSGVFAGTVSSFVIGSLGTATANYYDGRIRRARYWKRMLTSDERTDLYNAGAGRAYSYFE